jgi:hypothetical protein
MKFSILVLIAAVAYGVTPLKQPVQVQPKEIYETNFDKIKTDYSKKSADIEKARKASQEAAKKATISDSTLKVQEDSSAIIAKNLLKSSYDAEITKITTQENVLKTKRAKLDSLYKEAVATFEKK